MSEPYLIEHKVRNQPAFDIATRMQCPICNGDGCHECDDLGYWWIIPTSGHRAYPYFAEELNLLIDWPMAAIHGRIVGDMPPNLPDHYPINAAPTFDLATALGLHKAKPAKPFPRRL